MSSLLSDRFPIEGISFHDKSLNWTWMMNDEVSILVAQADYFSGLKSFIPWTANIFVSLQGGQVPTKRQNSSTLLRGLTGPRTYLTKPWAKDPGER